MKQLFHIENNPGDNTELVLSIRLGERHFCFAVTNKNGNELYRLVYCTNDEWTEEALDEFLAAYPALKQAYDQVLVTYDHSLAVLTPSSYYRVEDTELLLKSMYGEQLPSQIISDLVAEHQLYNSYVVPKEILDWMSRKYPAGNFQHQYSLAIKKISGVNPEGRIQVDFRTNDFTLVTIKGSQILLAQTFSYSTPEDVLYYLLKVCHQFSLSQQEVQVELSGLIDHESALYKELYLYFLHTRFREACWNDPGNEYPAHFFTSLNDLAQCAS